MHLSAQSLYSPGSRLYSLTYRLEQCGASRQGEEVQAVRRKKQDEPNSDRQSLYSRLVVVTVPYDPPLDELPSPRARLVLATVPFSLPDACPAGCLARQNDGGNVLA
jgi:hypothetical protein